MAIPSEMNNGKTYTCTLEPGATLVDAENAAARLFKEFRLVVLGKTPSSERFGGPLNYPKRGWC
jgi:hypothetical protein